MHIALLLVLAASQTVLGNAIELTPAEHILTLAINMELTEKWVIEPSDITMFNISQLIIVNPNFLPTNAQAEALMRELENWARDRTQNKPLSLSKLDLSDFKFDAKWKNYNEEVRNHPSPFFVGIMDNYMALREVLMEVFNMLLSLTTNPSADMLNEFRSNCTEAAETPIIKHLNIIVNQYKTKPECLGNTRTRSCVKWSNMHELLSHDYDRKKVLHYAKMFIIDWATYQLVSAACGYPYKITNDDWLPFSDQLRKTEKRLMEQWHEKQLVNDVWALIKPNYPQPGLIRAQHDDDIKRFLDEKYYWYRFRVHIYLDNIETVKGLLCHGNRIVYKGVDGQLVTDPGFKCVQKRNTLAIVRWAPVDTTVLLNPLEPLVVPPRRTLGRIPMNRQEKQDAKDEILKTSGGWNIGATAGQALAETSAPLTDAAGNVLKSSGFRKMLNAVGKLGQFMGPVGASISALLSLYNEEGTTNIISEIREGFKEMHTRFDLLERQVEGMHENIINKIERSFAFYNAYQIYWQNVLTPLGDLRRTEEDYLRLKFDDRKLQELKVFCDSSDPNNNNHDPFNLMGRMYQSFFENADRLGDTLYEWAKPDRSKLQKRLTILALEAAELSFFITTNCSAYARKNNAYDLAVTVADEAAMTQFRLNKILRKLSDLDEKFTYEWPQIMKKDIVKLLTELTGKKSDYRAVTNAVYEKLVTDYPWNNFQVVATKATKGLWSTFQWQYVANPDYAEIIVEGDWTVIINWNDKELTTDQQQPYNPTSESLNHCDNYPTALTRIKDANKPSNVQAVFVLKDRWGTHLKNDEGVTLDSSYGHKYTNDYWGNPLSDKNAKGFGGYLAPICTISYRIDVTDPRFFRCCTVNVIKFEDTYVQYLVNVGRGY